MDTADISGLVRSRLRSHRLAAGLSLEDLAERTHLGVSTLSRIETGKRTIDIGTLHLLCRALQVDISSILDTSADEDVVIRPVATRAGSITEWRLTRPGASDVVAAKWRFEPIAEPPVPQVHPGHDWFYVLSGAVELRLGERTLYVYDGQAAEFSTMVPHSITAHRRPAEVITIFDRTGHRIRAEDGVEEDHL
ncbi:MAG: XRE family transcriptional regulator [Ornithinimicrobium sp.]